nr:hypothetical protein [Tanacetum cinerariifolium]
ALRDKIICDLDKTPDFSQRSPQNCPKCGNPVKGHYCQGCAVIRQTFKEDLFASAIKHGIIQDSSEPSNDNSNVVNAPREPFVVNQDPGKNSSQSPPQINHHCCCECGDPSEGIFSRQCTCKLCGNGAHYGYNCPPKVLIILDPEPFNNQTIKELPPTMQSFDPKPDLVHKSPNVFNPPPQLSFISCEFCRNEAQFQGFHDFQQQDLCCENGGVTHEAYQCQPKNQGYYHEQNSCYDSNSFGFDQFQPQHYAVNHPVFNAQHELFDSQNKLMEQLTSMCDMISQLIQKKEEEKKIEEAQAANARYWKIPACYDDDDDYNFAITPNKPVNSLSMGDDHPDTVSATKSDEFIKSSVENLVPIPSESEGESECDVPTREEFTTFLNILFDADYEFDSSDDQSFFDEDVLEKIFSNPLFEKEIIPMKIEKHRQNAESDLIESPHCDFEEDIRFIEKLLYANSSPRPPREFVSTNYDAEIESFSPSPIPVKDSDSFIEEIDLSFTLDYPMPSGIKDDDYDSKRDILIFEDLPSNDTLSILEKESFHFDIPSFSRPPAKPPDGDTRILNVKMMGDISNQKVPMPTLMITLASHQEKSPDLLSHRSLKTFQPSAKCPMMIHGKNIPILDVPLFHFYPP